MNKIYSPNKIISVFIEHHNGTIEPVSYELIGKAKKIAMENHMSIYGVICLSQKQILDLSYLEYLVDYIDIYEYDEDYILNILDYRDCLNSHIYEYNPMIVLVGATPLGKSFAPRVAAHFKTGITADCVELKYSNDDGLIQIRPAYGGDLIAKIITPEHYPKMATVRPGVMEMPKYKNETKGDIVKNRMRPIHRDIQLLERVKKEGHTNELEDAEIVVLAGNAIKYPEELELIMELGKLLDAEWAVTRPLVEGGLAPYERQVGVSGKTIRPKFVLAFGVSGSNQTFSGISKAEKIIAINKDKDSPIFKKSDMGILNDWEIIAKELIEKLRV